MSNIPWHMITLLARGRGPMATASSSSVFTFCR